MGLDTDFDDCTTEFDLSGAGEGASYRVPVKNAEGEFTRSVMKNMGKKFVVTATLLDAVHGKMEEGGADNATLLILTFRFLPAANGRFKMAQIDWTFTSDDPAISISVNRIAPDGRWISDPQTLKLKRTSSFKISAGPSAGPVKADAEGSHTSEKAKDLVYHTSVDGATMMSGGRNQRGYNSIRWILKENPEDTHEGICRMLQVGVLLNRTVIPGKKPKPRPQQTFRSTMKIAVDKDMLSSFRTAIADRAEKEDDPVIYYPHKPNISGDFIIDENNLGKMSLTDDVMYMSRQESFDEMKTVRQEKKKAKLAAEEKKKQEEEEEEKKKRQKQEEEEEEEKKKKKKQEEDAKGDGGKAAVASNANQASLPKEQIQDILPTAQPTAQTPVWLYVVLGIMGMYISQQLMKSWFGGT